MNCYFDLETTGLNYRKHSIIEIALIFAESFEVKDTYHAWVKPRDKSYSWSYEAEKIHGYSEDQVSGFLGWETVVKEVEEKLIKNNCGKMYSHCLNKFDYNFLRMFLKDSSVLPPFHSTLNMAIKNGYKNNSLSNWAKRINFKLDHHKAMSDALCCMKIHKYLTHN